MRKPATKEKPAPGAVEVRIVGTDEEPFVEVEFYPQEGRPIGVRMRPDGAFVLAGRLAEALAELGLLDELPPRLN